MNINQMHKIAVTFRSLMNVSVEMNKQARYYNTDILIYPAEIHYLLMISKSAVINVTDLALQMKVTKGAVSQILNKLQKKGLIERYKKGNDEKAVYISLTELGKVANIEHQRMESEFFARLFETLGDVNEDDANRFHEILTCVVDTIKD